MKILDKKHTAIALFLISTFAISLVAITVTSAHTPHGRSQHLPISMQRQTRSVSVNKFSSCFGLTRLLTAQQ